MQLGGMDMLENIMAWFQGDEFRALVSTFVADIWANIVNLLIEAFTQNFLGGAV